MVITDEKSEEEGEKEGEIEEERLSVKWVCNYT